MRNSVLWYGGTAAVVVLAVLITAWQPMLGVAALIAVVALISLLLIPRDRVALVTGSAAMALLMVFPVQYMTGNGSLKIGVLGAVAALGLGTLVLRHKSLSGSRGLWLFVAYFALVALATPRSLEPSSWNLLMGIAVAGLTPAVIFAMMNAGERKSAIRFIVFLASAQAAYSIFELIASRPPMWGYTLTASGAPQIMMSQIDTSLVRSQGTMGHPLPLALLLLVAIALVIRGAAGRTRLTRAAIVALLFAGCFAAGSRSAVLVAIVLVFLGIGRKHRLTTLIAGSFLLMVTWLIAVAAGFLNSGIYERFVGSYSLSHRTGAVDAVPGLLADQDFINTVFGNGYFSAYQLFRDGLLQVGNFFAVDNQVVMTLVEAGIVGVAVLLLLVFRAAVRIDVGVRLAFLSIVVFFFTFDVLSWPSGVALFGMCVGLAFARTSGEPEPDVSAGDVDAISSPAETLALTKLP